MRRILWFIMTSLILLPVFAVAQTSTLIGMGTKAVGEYPFGPIAVPENATEMKLRLDRGNIFTKSPTFTAYFEGIVLQGVERLTGCFNQAIGGQRVIGGQPVTHPAQCGASLPDLSGLTLEGKLVIGGESGNVGLEVVFE